jgi:hypothetical protein
MKDFNMRAYIDIINESNEIEEGIFTATPENGFSMDVELRANSLDELWDMIEEWYHSDPKARAATGVPYDREMEAQLIDDTLTISNYIFGVEKDGEMLSAEEMNSVNQFDSDGEIVTEGNMSYVMMENTSRDLYECLQTLREHGSIENWREATDPSTYEEEGIEGLMASCKEMVEEFGSEKR